MMNIIISNPCLGRVDGFKQQATPNRKTTSRKILRIKVTPDLHLTYSKNGGNLGLVLKIINIVVSQFY